MTIYSHCENYDYPNDDVIEKAKRQLLGEEERYQNSKIITIQRRKQLPLLSVLEAKRSSEGLVKVVGRIVGRSTNFKIISKTEWKCQEF